MKLIIKTAADLDAERAAQAREVARVEALAYLARTDWLVVRQAETGAPVPEAIMQARAEARRMLNT